MIKRDDDQPDDPNAATTYLALSKLSDPGDCWPLLARR